MTAGEVGQRSPLRLLLPAIFLVSLNLRAPLTALPPLVPALEGDLGLSGPQLGALTTLPVLCMGLLAPPAQRLAARVGQEQAVAGGLVLLVFGSLLRWSGTTELLFAGTAFVGAGIAIAGTLLPGLVKHHVRGRGGAVTALYIFGMMVGATAAAAVAVPVADALAGWPPALAVWGLPAALALVAWLPVLRFGSPGLRDDDRTRQGLPWRSRTALLLAAYLSLQSTQFYTQLAWLPAAYESRGWTPAAAGVLLAVFSISQIVSGTGGPALADRRPDHRVLLAWCVGLTTLGLAGVVLAPDAAPYLWAAILGLGQGGAFAVALVLFVEYARDPAESARLTAMCFLTSYTAASVGPVWFGALRDLTGGTGLPFIVLLVLSASQLLLVVVLRPALKV